MAQQREKILEAAKKVFGKHGLKKAGMQDIARAAKMGKASIYHYFDGKEDLFRAMVEDEISDFRSKIKKEVLGAQTTPQRKLRNLVFIRMRKWKEMMGRYPAMKKEYEREMPHVEEIRAEVLKHEVTMVTDILKEGVAKNVFSVPNPRLTASVIVQAMKGLEYPWLMNAPKKTFEKDLQALLDILLKGILAR